MRTNAKWKWATSVFVAVCLTAGQLEMTALAASPDGALSIAIAEEPRASASTGVIGEIVVDVRNGDAPAAGANVEFSLPESGPGGLFANGGRRRTVQADAQGRARSGNIYANDVPGPFTVAVQASQEGTTAGATVPQTNPPTTPEAPKRNLFQKMKNWKVLAAIAAAGAVVATVLLTRDEKPVDVTVGVPSVGGPQ